MVDAETFKKQVKFAMMRKNKDYRECPNRACNHMMLGNKKEPSMVCEKCKRAAVCHDSGCCRCEARTVGGQAFDVGSMEVLMRIIQFMWMCRWYQVLFLPQQCPPRYQLLAVCMAKEESGETGTERDRCDHEEMSQMQSAGGAWGWGR